MFEFLFKYRPVVFERGDFSFALPSWAFVVTLIALGLLVVFALQYRSVGPMLGRRDRWMLSALRFVTFSVLAFILFRPVLLVSTVVPRRNYVAVLVDDSRSMRVADENGFTRAQRAIELFGGGPADSVAGVADASVGSDAGEVRRALEDRFRVRMYGFDADATRTGAAEQLTFGGDRTSLGTALARVQQEMSGLPLSGIVVVTDGADNADVPLSESLLELQAARLPVYTVGLGEERITPDLEVRRIELPRRALEGTTLVADVILSHSGLAGRTVRVDVEDDGRIVGTRDIELGPDGEVPVQIQFTLEDSGPRTVRVAVAPIEGEAVTENNERRALLEVADARRKVLYFEGSPRPELKFLRRAVADDENLQVVTLLRTADEKFLRLGVDGPTELEEGFPTTREELFGYAGLILGSVEASFFTHDQLQMMADFVGQRGGGLLVLGGDRAFAEGGYGGTPLADALPVVLDAAGEPAVVEVLPELTPAGRRHPAMRIAGDEGSSAELWAALPPLTSVNRVTRVKPGAVTLLDARPVDGSDARVLLAHQRYGRGTAIALAVQDSWLWQMHADIPVEDQTHETFWRQLIRWLVHDAPDRARLDLGENAASPGEPLTIRAEIEDERFLRVNGARVTATVTTPSGATVDVPLEWTVERDGEYEGRYVPEEPGLYQVALDARPAGGRPAATGGEAGATLGTPGDSIVGGGFFRAGPAEREAYGAGRRTELLRRVAEETGGRFYTADEAGVLPEEIQYTESGDTLYEERPLWDLPILFLLLGITLSAEWAYRRRKDLA